MSESPERSDSVKFQSDDGDGAESSLFFDEVNDDDDNVRSSPPEQTSIDPPLLSGPASPDAVNTTITYAIEDSNTKEPSPALEGANVERSLSGAPAEGDTPKKGMKDYAAPVTRPVPQTFQRSDAAASVSMSPQRLVAPPLKRPTEQSPARAAPPRNESPREKEPDALHQRPPRPPGAAHSRQASRHSEDLSDFDSRSLPIAFDNNSINFEVEDRQTATDLYEVESSQQLPQSDSLVFEADPASPSATQCPSLPVDGVRNLPEKRESSLSTSASSVPKDVASAEIKNISADDSTTPQGPVLAQHVVPQPKNETDELNSIAKPTGTRKSESSQQKAQHFTEKQSQTLNRLLAETFASRQKRSFEEGQRQSQPASRTNSRPASRTSSVHRGATEGPISDLVVLSREGGAVSSSHVDPHRGAMLRHHVYDWMKGHPPQAKSRSASQTDERPASTDRRRITPKRGQSPLRVQQVDQDNAGKQQQQHGQLTPVRGDDAEAKEPVELSPRTVTVCSERKKPKQDGDATSAHNDTTYSAAQHREQVIIDPAALESKRRKLVILYGVQRGTLEFLKYLAEKNIITDQAPPLSLPANAPSHAEVEATANGDENAAGTLSQRRDVWNRLFQAQTRHLSPRRIAELQQQQLNTTAGASPHSDKSTDSNRRAHQTEIFDKLYKIGLDEKAKRTRLFVEGQIKKVEKETNEVIDAALKARVLRSSSGQRATPREFEVMLAQEKKKCIEQLHGIANKAQAPQDEVVAKVSACEHPRSLSGPAVVPFDVLQHVEAILDLSSEPKKSQGDIEAMTLRLHKQGRRKFADEEKMKTERELAGCTFKPIIIRSSSASSTGAGRSTPRSNSAVKSAETPRTPRGGAVSTASVRSNSSSRCESLFKMAEKAKVTQCNNREKILHERRLKILKDKMASDHHFRKRVAIDPSLATKFMESLPNTL